jgi:MoaA/NifB/PqqE/SkfB family radical SAM enzyme
LSRSERLIPLSPVKFANPDVTADGEPRAHVSITSLRTLWFNTGTLCNLSCENCYIESTPRNDRLVYLTPAEARSYLDEIETLGLPTEEIGITGGEPFMNPDILDIIGDSLRAGYRTLVLTNAMRPMMKLEHGLTSLREAFGDRLTLRVSVDHYERKLHEEERGPRSWKPMLAGLQWLAQEGFKVHVAGRLRWDDDESRMRDGFAAFFAEHEIPIDAHDPVALVLFPEMDERADVAEITTACWDILGKRPEDVMCASSRMVIKRKGEARPVVVSCTLLPYDQQFQMGHTLRDALGPVKLNHVHCAKFCVLGGASCSPD